MDDGVGCDIQQQQNSLIANENEYLWFNVGEYKR